MADAIDRSDRRGGDPGIGSARSSPEGSAAAADRYWSGMDRERTAARSLGRAEMALSLLARAGIRSGRLLDVGCGPGWAMERFRRAGFDVRGLEISPVAAAEARKRGLAADVVDVEACELDSDPRARHDVVTALETLEHVRDPLRLLGAMAKALAPGGRIVVSLPNEFHLPRRLALLVGRPQGAGHRRFGGHDDPHVRHFTPRLARRLFEAAGLRELGCEWDGLAPARWRFLKGVSNALAGLRPGLFALSGVFLLEPEGLR